MYTDQPAPNMLAETRRLVILPIGSCEQHGPYLPIDTDLRIAQLLAEKLTRSFLNLEPLLLPAIPFSCSWEHKGLGTLALNVSTLAAVIHDVPTALKRGMCLYSLFLSTGMEGMISWHRSQLRLLHEKASLLQLFPAFRKLGRPGTIVTSLVRKIFM